MNTQLILSGYLYSIKTDNEVWRGGFLGAYLGQKCLHWGILGHDWDVITHMNFIEFHTMSIFNVLNITKKTHALGRSLVISKMPASRS